METFLLKSFSDYCESHGDKWTFLNICLWKNAFSLATERCQPAFSKLSFALDENQAFASFLGLKNIIKLRGFHIENHKTATPTLS